MSTLDVIYGRGLLRVRSLLDRRLNSPADERDLRRVYASLMAAGCLLQLPITTAREIVRGRTVHDELALARGDVDEVLRGGFEMLWALERNASGDRDGVTDAAHDRRALDALTTILSTSFERLGVGRARGGEDPHRDQERQQREGDEQHEAEQVGESHVPNVRPLTPGEVS